MTSANAEPPSGKRIGLEVRLANATDRPLLIDFFRRVWGTSATEADTATPSSPSVVAVGGHGVVGYLGTIPTQFRQGSRVVPAFWAKGLMVVPEFRNGPIGFHLVRSLARECPVLGATVVAAPARGLFAMAGFRDYGQIPNFLHPLRFGRLLTEVRLGSSPMEHRGWAPRLVEVGQRVGLARAGGGLLDLVAAARAAIHPTYRAAAQLDVSTDWDPEAATVIAACADPSWVGAVRDCQELVRRYGAMGEARGGRYKAVVLRRAGTPIALAIVRLAGRAHPSRLGSLRLGVLTEAVFPEDDFELARKLLIRTSIEARRLGCEALLATASHSTLQRALRGAGYMRVPGNVHFMLKAPDPQAWPAQLDHWWLTRGDGGADEAF